MKRSVDICVLISIAAVAGACAAGGARGASNSPVTFEEYGFKLEIPRPFEKHVPPPKPGERLSQAYLSGGLAYIIKITDVGPDSLASTVVEQTLQAQVKQASQARRWERNSRYGELFKGFTCLTKVDLNSAPFLEKIMGGDTGYQSVSLAPLAGESSPILTIGIIGAKERSVEIDNLAEFLVSTVSTFKIAHGTKPKDVSLKHPAAVSAAKPAAGLSQKPSAQAALRPNEIELVGRVDSVGPGGDSITMTVDQIRLPKQGPIKLDPARTKLVYCKKLPSGAGPGTRLLVVGVNTGVGKPMSADRIEVQPGPK